MHPVLFHIYKFPVHSYGLMLALSFLVGILYGGWRAKRRGLNPEVITDVGFWVVLSAIVGSRLYYVLLHPEDFKGNLLDIINPIQEGQLGIGGLVMFGGYIGALIAGVVFFKAKKLPFLPYADAAAPSLGIGIFFTRIGCFLNGCCYGAATHSAIGVSFPITSPAGAYQHEIHAAALYPSQLFLSAGGLLIALIIITAERKKMFTGFSFFLAGLLYSVLRFAVDFTRFYYPGEKIGPLSHNQIVCIVFFVVFLGLIVRQAMFGAETAGQKNPSPPPPAPSA
jgi:phosphatidylglycerol:prolipoprotein diacylglycerol transferase